MTRLRFLSAIILLMTVFSLPSYAQRKEKSTNAKDLGLFTKVELSEKSVYSNQPVLCTVKLYNPGYDLSNIQSIGNADYSTCDMRATVIPRDAYYIGKEKVNGTIYNVAVISQSVLFPTESGNVRIKCPDFKVNVATGTEQYYGFFQRRITETVTVATEETMMKVKKLPSKGKPADFSGAVGDFKIKLTVPPGKITRGSDCICIFTVTGNGSLEDAVFPKVADIFPAELDVKSMSSDEQVYLNQGNIIAEGVYEVTFRPSKTGRFTIPSVGFSYFNPATGKYEKTYSEPQDIDVHSLSSNPSSGPVLI